MVGEGLRPFPISHGVDMQTIRNLTNSPYSLEGTEGAVLLPAFGSVDGEFSGEYLDLLRSSGAVSVEDTDKPKRGRPRKANGNDDIHE